MQRSSKATQRTKPLFMFSVTAVRVCWWYCGGCGMGGKKRCSCFYIRVHKPERKSEHRNNNNRNHTTNNNERKRWRRLNTQNNIYDIHATNVIGREKSATKMKATNRPEKRAKKKHERKQRHKHQQQQNREKNVTSNATKTFCHGSFRILFENVKQNIVTNVIYWAVLYPNIHIHSVWFFTFLSCSRIDSIIFQKASTMKNVYIVQAFKYSTDITF